MYFDGRRSYCARYNQRAFQVMVGYGFAELLIEGGEGFSLGF